MTPNQKAFLDTLAYSELGAELIAMSDDGYNVIVERTPGSPILFPVLSNGLPDYSDHPRMLIHLGAHLESTAAGRYQLLARYFDPYKAKLRLSDFGKAAQDAIALQQILEQDAIRDIDAGEIEDALTNCNNIWASLPGSPYGQHTNSLESLCAYYESVGGTTS